MPKREKEKTSKKNYPFIWWLIVGAMLIALGFAAYKTYVLRNINWTELCEERINVNTESSIFDILWNTDSISATIGAAVIPVLIFILNRVFKIYIPPLYILLWGGIFVMSNLIFRVAYEMSISRAAIFYFSSFIYLLVSGLFVWIYNKDTNKVDSLLYNAYGGRLNKRKILSIQLFSLKETDKKYSDDITYEIKRLDSIVSEYTKDIESINQVLQLRLKLPKKEYNYFQEVLRQFSTITAQEIDSSPDIKESIEKLKQSIKNHSDYLKDILNNIDYTKPIDNKYYCLFRVLESLKAIEVRLNDDPLAVLNLEDGALGLDSEKELFLRGLRTGLLGAILFSKDMRYYFSHRKPGAKRDRSYCAFMLDPEKYGVTHDTEYKICLVMIRENTGDLNSFELANEMHEIEEKICNQLRKDIKYVSDI